MIQLKMDLSINMWKNSDGDQIIKSFGTVLIK